VENGRGKEVQKNNDHAKNFFRRNGFRFIKGTESGILIERELKENVR